MFSRGGEREMTVQVTYTDGRESGRSIVRSKQLTKPVNAKLGIGIGQAQPYSEETVVEGSGHFLWPLNGGRITCRYGGERDHWGLDIGAAEDTEIYAADKGIAPPPIRGYRKDKGLDTHKIMRALNGMYDYMTNRDGKEPIPIEVFKMRKNVINELSKK